MNSLLSENGKFYWQFLFENIIYNPLWYIVSFDGVIIKTELGISLSRACLWAANLLAIEFSVKNRHF